MKMPLALENVLTRFDRMSLRERGLISFGVLAAIVMIWDAAFMQPLQARQTAMSDELQRLQEAISVASKAAEITSAIDPTAAALDRQQAAQAALSAIDAQLESASAGLVPPERMVELIHDVLSRQSNLKLVALRNQPVVGVVTDEASGVEVGPYTHPVELVVEGRYLDVLDYLRALEALPWRFRWQVLELQTMEYPMNRVRIELSTLSMEKEWLGV